MSGNPINRNDPSGHWEIEDPFPTAPSEHTIDNDIIEDDTIDDGTRLLPLEEYVPTFLDWIIDYY